MDVAFPSEAVSFEGTLADYASKADSGNIMHRRFCPTCGTHVTIQSEARPHLLSVRAKPSMTIWTSMAPSWAPIDPNIPQAERQQAPPVRPPKA